MSWEVVLDNSYCPFLQEVGSLYKCDAVANKDPTDKCSESTCPFKQEAP